VLLLDNSGNMAEAVGRSRWKQVPLSEVKRALSHILREAQREGIVITRSGQPADVLGLRPRKFGSTTSSKPTPDFRAVSTRRGPACERATV